MSQVTVSLLKAKRYVASWFLPEVGAQIELGVQKFDWVVTLVKGKGWKPAWVERVGSSEAQTARWRSLALGFLNCALRFSKAPW